MALRSDSFLTACENHKLNFLHKYNKLISTNNSEVQKWYCFPAGAEYHEISCNCTQFHFKFQETTTILILAQHK